MPTAVTEASFSTLAPARVQRAAVVEAGVRVRIWDLPTRVFHWSLAASLVGLTATGYAGGAWMAWHARIGSLLLALLLFRVVWGFIGGRWSRFVNFVPTPGALKRYLRGPATPEQDAGHSPLGALSILAMMAVLLGQAVTGLLGDDGGGFTGPWNELVSSATGFAATALHKQVGQWLLFALVLLHVLAIVFYRVVRRRKLVRAMLDGDKLLPRRVPPARDDARSRALATAVLLACLCVVGFVTGF
ncbi:cytochrome b/b6 domain-containing protein [Ramlibacter sp. XY19]|uniref:cytochrome b/b6 domain-containing protein n=1 Tax=Ramlibacter paludis TaxID=2908000 RepID=UPI0023DC9BBF|nr:cytochrome b/b6 domain-containing protein [Ramlibacter paludis]MCG2593657.1 cytochrome b/b6 domain-containing protein [Ramlibacter paludis]